MCCVCVLQVIPVYEQGSQFQPSAVEMLDGQTSPPQLLTEADLISLMEKHGIGTDTLTHSHTHTHTHTHLHTQAKRQTYRDGKRWCVCVCIDAGTDATHAEHIETIKSRSYVGLTADQRFLPGELGMGLVEGTVHLSRKLISLLRCTSLPVGAMFKPVCVCVCVCVCV